MIAKHSSIQVHENTLGFQYQIFETWCKNSTQFFSNKLGHQNFIHCRRNVLWRHDCEHLTTRRNRKKQSRAVEKFDRVAGRYSRKQKKAACYSV